MDHCKNWTRQQTELRKLLSAKTYFAEGIQLFLRQHAAVHTAAVSGCPDWSLQDEVLAGLPEEQYRACPRPGMNSIAWLLWHTARIEDITLSFLVFEQAQVLLREDWTARLGLPLRDVGAGMDESDVANLSRQISIRGLLDYRAAVGRNTQAAVVNLQAAQLKEIVPGSTVQRLEEDGSISARAPWLTAFYSNRPKGFFLTRITSHNYIHLAEAGRVPGLLGKACRKN
jgi:hypothetical protein